MAGVRPGNGDQVWAPAPRKKKHCGARHGAGDQVHASVNQNKCGSEQVSDRRVAYIVTMERACKC
eukprot:1158454-Pelagomonas_calceolata.AAC.10